MIGLQITDVADPAAAWQELMTEIEPTTSITWRSLEISGDLRLLKEIGDMIDIHYLVQ